NLVLEMVAEKLDDSRYHAGCMFDGFPRTLAQARSLDAMLAKRGTPLDLALELRADKDELLTRMVKRAAAEGRADDNPQTSTHILEVYRKQTTPLLDYYRFKGTLSVIDAMGTPDDVFTRIKSAVEKRRQA